MTTTAEHRSSFQSWLTSVGMAAIAAIAIWIGTQMKELTISVQNLSREIAIVSERTAADRSRIDRLEAKYDRIEGRR